MKRKILPWVAVILLAGAVFAETSTVVLAVEGMT